MFSEIIKTVRKNVAMLVGSNDFEVDLQVQRTAERHG